tara:strand:+ start:1262 stop:1864 length:603 start_codon:yes stop_codon:yes gene_type:complete
VNKVLFLGNSPAINDIDFDRIDPNVTIVGTNRAWLKVIPDYLFFHDIKIFKELDASPDRFKELKHKCKFISSDWLGTQCKKQKITGPAYVKVYPRPNRYKFVDCVTTAMEIYDRYISKTKNTYYVAGVSLAWSEPSHFWKVRPADNIGNGLNEKWYEPRFKKTYANFEDLKRKGFDIISVSPGSKINKIFRYEHVANLYS